MLYDAAGLTNSDDLAAVERRAHAVLSDHAAEPGMVYQAMLARSIVACQRRQWGDATRLVDEANGYAWHHGLDHRWQGGHRIRIWLAQTTIDHLALVDLARDVAGAPLPAESRAEALLLCGDLYWWAGFLRRAEHCVRQALDLNDRPEARLQLAELLLTLDEPAEALSVLADIWDEHRAGRLERCTLRLRARGRRMQALLRVGERGEALAEAEAIETELAVSPPTTRLRGLLRLAGFYTDLGDVARARDLLDAIPGVNLIPYETEAVLRVRADSYAVDGDWVAAHRYRKRQLAVLASSRASSQLRAEVRRQLVGAGFGSQGDETIEAKQRELEEYLAERSQLTTVVAKDLRGPLASVKVALDLAGGSTPSSETADLLDAAIRSLELEVALLTDHDQVESPTREIDLEVVDIHEAIRRAVESVRPLLKRHTVSIEPGPGMDVLAAVELLQTILSDIVREIAHHAPRGSRIEITTTRSGSWIDVLFRSVTPVATSDALAAPTVGEEFVQLRSRYLLNRLIHAVHGQLFDRSSSDHQREVVLRLQGSDAAPTV